MENMEEIEAKFMELVKAQYDKTGGSNGLDTFEVNKILGITEEEFRDMIQKLLKEKKIAYLNHLNGRSIILPK